MEEPIVQNGPRPSFKKQSLEKPFVEDLTKKFSSPKQSLKKESLGKNSDGERKLTEINLSDDSSTKSTPRNKSFGRNSNDHNHSIEIHPHEYVPPKLSLKRQSSVKDGQGDPNEEEEQEDEIEVEDQPLDCTLESNREACDAITRKMLEQEQIGEFEEEDEEEMEQLEVPAIVSPNYKLNDFVRAKEYFLTSSTKTGISLYEHFSELIRKLLDNRAPENPVDFVEELSLNLKRYRFGMTKDLIQDSFYISESKLKDAKYLMDNWRKHAMWSTERKDIPPEGGFGGFSNLLRLQYYLEQINIGLPREEMFRIALLLRQLRVTRPISRIRFWGKIFGTEKNYYVVELELSGEETEQDTWIAPIDSPITKTRNWNDEEEDEEEMEDPSKSVPGAGDTFRRAGGVVTNTEFLSAYQQTSIPPPNSGRGNGNEFLGEHLFDFMNPDEAKEAERWQKYQLELMSGFPIARIPEIVEIPPEKPGEGVNRRIFYVCNDLTEDWVRLPSVTPQQIIASRNIRWFLTGMLDAKIQSTPPFPGREGHYLRALLARITAGTQVSPKGYYRTTKYDDEEEGEDEEEDEEAEEEEEESKNDIVYPKKLFRPTNIGVLTNPGVDLWVHHVSYILRQGRNNWINLEAKNKVAVDDDEEEVEEEEEDEEEEEVSKNKEIGPPLLTSLAEDKSLDMNPSINPWSARASSSVFTEFQVANVRSNLWPGANALCTVKGKVENIYLGDGLKFFGHSYAPPIPEECEQEYKEGPELVEVTDPSVQDEQTWLAKLQLNEIADIEEKFVDNESSAEGEEEEEEEDEEEDDDD